jgi:hypothetical protein
MGQRRTGHRALGLAAVTQRRTSGVAPLALTSALLLAGCSSVGAIAGAAVGASTGAATVNPIVGYVTAVGVNAGVDALQKYIARVRQGAEQDAIVSAVGEMQPGESRPWKIVHDIPMFDDEHGRMQVVRAIDTPLVQCKEVLFTVDSGRGAHEKRVPYVTDACHDTKGWKWAAAEPATERWGYFQHISH